MHANSEEITMKIFPILVMLFFISGCTGPDIQQYTNMQPTFDAETFFNGPLTAHGVLKDRSGQVTRHFNATINAHWKDGVGTLEERFEFNDGEIQFRNWRLTPRNGGGYIATAGDVLGEGQAETAGNVFHLEYTLEILYQGKPLALAVDDWMFRVSDKVVINQSTLSKWGFRVGSIELAIIRQ
jgi:hypothetical protein